MSMLNIAVVGTGGRAQSHLATIPKLKDIYQLTAVCDINAERARQASERFGVKGYTNVEQMFDIEPLLKTSRLTTVLADIKTLR